MIGKGDRISYWKDNWLGVPLIDAMNIPMEAHKYLTSRVSDVIDSYSWIIPNVIAECVMDLVDVIYSVIILKQPMGDAHLIRKDSKDGHFSSKQAYKFLNPHSSSFWPVKIMNLFLLQNLLWFGR